MAVILEEQIISGFVDGECFKEGILPIAGGETYKIVWDGVEYELIAFEMNGGVAVGNKMIIGEQDSGEPFVIATAPAEVPGSTDMILIASTDTSAESHIVAIYTVEEEKGVTIILYDRTGGPVTHEGVETITTDTPDAERGATFTYGVAVDNVEYEPNFSNGNQKVTLKKGQLLKEFTLKKPETLLPEHIKKNVEIAGVIGEFAGDETEKTVELNMANGNQVIEADKDTVLTKVTVKKPEALVPENIAEGVEIAGIIGTHECAGYTITDIIERGIEGELNDANVTSIGSYAFAATAITKVAFPACAKIGSYAFADCAALSILELNYNEMTEVARGAFKGTNITEINLPLCNTLGAEAFRDCKKIKEVNLPKLSHIGGVAAGAFSGCVKLEKIEIEANVSSFSEYAFYSCNKLSDIGEITMLKVGDYAFTCCSELSVVSFGTGMCSVGTAAFSGCEKLEAVEGEIFLNGASCSGFNYTFNNCEMLKSITIGMNKPMYGSGAFRGCTALSKLTLCADTVVFPIDSYFFDTTPFSGSTYLGKYGSIYVPSKLFYDFKSAEGWSVYSARMVSYTV